MISNLESL